MADAGFEIRGSEDLRRLAAELKDVGENQLRRDLLKGIRDAAKPGIEAVRQSARETLPRSGGLAERVASQVYAVRTSAAGSSAKVSIAGKGMKGLRDIDSGQVRHPVYGSDTWVSQSVPPGFFTKALMGRAPSIRDGIENVIKDIDQQIDRSVS